MNYRYMLVVAAVVCAALYLWPDATTKAAKRIGDTTISAVKAGAHEATK